MKKSPQTAPVILAPCTQYDKSSYPHRERTDLFMNSDCTRWYLRRTGSNPRFTDAPPDTPEPTRRGAILSCLPRRPRAAQGCCLRLKFERKGTTRRIGSPDRLAYRRRFLALSVPQVVAAQTRAKRACAFRHSECRTPAGPGWSFPERKLPSRRGPHPSGRPLNA